MIKKLSVALAAIMMVATAAAQKIGLRPSLMDKDAFSIIVIPDVQCYVKYKANQPILDLMTAWVDNNKTNLNIKTALCTGDLVDRNNSLVANRNNMDQTSKQMWQATSRAFSFLDGVMPYVVCTGNHDYGLYESAVNRESQMPNYFYPDRNSCWQKSIVDVGLNAFGQPTLENAAYEIETGSSKWGKLLVISLEFAPSDRSLEWAKSVVSKPKYKNTNVIVLTHSFLDKNGNLKKTEKYKLTDANYGQAIWDKLIYPSSNIRMVVCGHVCSIAPYNEQVSFRSAKNADGKTVAQMMFNAQTADGEWAGNGGDGWLRILEFEPDGHTIGVRTFSPLFAVSKITCDKAWRTASYDQFTIDLDK